MDHAGLWAPNVTTILKPEAVSIVLRRSRDVPITLKFDKAVIRASEPRIMGGAWPVASSPVLFSIEAALGDVLRAKHLSFRGSEDVLNVLLKHLNFESQAPLLDTFSVDCYSQRAPDFFHIRCQFPGASYTHGPYTHCGETVADCGYVHEDSFELHY